MSRGPKLGRECGKCGGDMQPGFLAEQRQLEEGLRVAWHPGEPRAEKASFLGIDINLSTSVRLDPEKLETVTTYRCRSCGYLEAYTH